jgi:Rrf2 family protein
MIHSLRFMNVCLQEIFQIYMIRLVRLKNNFPRFTHSNTLIVDMSKIVAYSEAASIGIHSMVLIARAGDMMNVMKIAEATGSSKHHVAKILQRLVKEGFLGSTRGPSGGFALQVDPAKVSLLNIYEAIEGKVIIPNCPNEHQVCPFLKCIMGTVVGQMTQLFIDYLKANTVADLVHY